MLPTAMELRIALRTLRRSKAFATFSIMALALAIAANTTMSALVDALLYPTYAFPHPQQLMMGVFNTPGVMHMKGLDLRGALGDSGRTYEGVSGWAGGWPFVAPGPVIIGGHAMQAAALHVDGNYFKVVGSRPERGALFYDATAEDRHLAVIADRLWTRLDGAHRTFAPFTVTVSNVMYTVTGVLQPHAGAPADVDLFVATRPLAAVGRFALIRLRPGITRQQAMAELKPIARSIDPNHSDRASIGLVPEVPLHAKVGGLPLALGGATLAVLLIACANIANLLLARGMSRSRELATRMAFGATRLQAARLLFAESGLVAAAGGLAGLFLSFWTIHLLAASLPADLLGLGLVEPQLSWRVVAAGVGLTVMAAVVFGVAPVLLLRRADVGTLLKGGGSRTVTVGGARFRLLVVVEVAAALTLGVSASLLTAAAGRLQFLSLGYNAGHLVAGFISENRAVPAGPSAVLHGQTSPTGANARALTAERSADLSSIRSMPGVVSASVIWQGQLAADVHVARPDGTEPRVPIQSSVSTYFVDPQFLKTLGATLVEGRDFQVGEGGPVPSVILDQTAARWLWPHSSSIGQLIHFGPTDNGQPWMRVVGVVRPMLFRVDCGIDEPCERPLVLIANSTSFAAPPSFGEYAIRVRGAPSREVAQLAPLIAAAHPGGRSILTTWGDFTGLDAARVSHDFIASLFATFAAIGLLLALIGVYGVAAYGVERRSREFGVRIALGARGSDIIRHVLRDGNATALLGIAIGLLAANWGEQFIAKFLFGFDAQEPYFLASSVVLVFAATVVAGIPSALRAARVNPVDTLRSE